MNEYTQKIKTFLQEQKRMPSYAELAELCGFASKNAAFKLATRLIKAGVIAKDKSGRLLPGAAIEGVMNAGVGIAAGSTSAAGFAGASVPSPIMASAAQGLEIPFMGLVEAGFPTVAEELPTETVDVAELLPSDPGKFYFFEVKGESMIEAGICEGDMVLVERTNGREPRVGDIVIAYVDGGWTMKYFMKNSAGKPFLRPANKKFADIKPKEELQVAGVVRRVVRKV